MFAERRLVARGAQQSLPLLRHLNTCIGQRKIFSSENVWKSPGFSSENPFSGNGVFPISLVPLHLQTGFMYFSAIPQDSRDGDFSELDAKEMKEDEGCKDAITYRVPSLTSIFSNQYAKKSVNSVTYIPSENNEKKSVKSVTYIPSEKKEKQSVKSVTSIPSEKNKEKSVNSATSIPEKKEEKSLKSVTSISSKKTEKKIVKSEQQQKTTPKTKEKVEGVSDIMEHPWPEWVQFLEHLNERGYLSKAFHFQGPIELRGLSTERIYAFIKFAAFSFVEDHVEISKLSRSDLKKVALHCCPSVEKLVVLAAKRLHSVYSTECDASLPINVDDTSNPPSVEVSKVKRLELEDVVRLLCAYGLNAEKNELAIPDDIKQSVVNLLKELVDISASSVNDD